ncbi:hypothetical protein H8958_017716, partial [Nasalis larvatus]
MEGQPVQALKRAGIDASAILPAPPPRAALTPTPDRPQGPATLGRDVHQRAQPPAGGRAAPAAAAGPGGEAQRAGRREQHGLVQARRGSALPVRVRHAHPAGLDAPGRGLVSLAAPWAPAWGYGFRTCRCCWRRNPESEM